MDHRSLEYWHIAISSDQPITTQPIDVSLDGGVTWHPAERTAQGARILVGAGTGLAEAAMTYDVLVRITDNPEVPVLHAGRRYVS